MFIVVAYSQYYGPSMKRSNAKMVTDTELVLALFSRYAIIKFSLTKNACMGVLLPAGRKRKPDRFAAWQFSPRSKL
jgi:hypothetical protein